jgi:hypothetical protein
MASLTATKGVGTAEFQALRTQPHGGLLSQMQAPSLGKPAGRLAEVRSYCWDPAISSSAVQREKARPAARAKPSQVVTQVQRLARQLDALMRGRLRGADNMHERRGTAPAFVGDGRPAPSSKPHQGAVCEMTAIRTLDATARSAAINEATSEEIASIRRKARSYALFGGRRFVAGDLLHDALVAALDGRPAWRADRSVVDYCDGVMARRVGFLSCGRKRGHGK